MSRNADNGGSYEKSQPDRFVEKNTQLDGPLHIPTALTNFPCNWSWSRLDGVCDGVFDCPHSTPELTESGPYVVRTQDIVTGVFRADQAAHISEKTYTERIARATPERGDLLYSREGTYFGIAAEVPENTRVCLGQRMVLIRPDKHRVDFRYLRYWLNSPIMASHIHGFRDGSVAERLNLPTIRGLPVLIPPFAEQKAIAHILGTLDDKIELNRKMNVTLEAMARALFKSWFADFDPVRAKLDGRQPAGIDAATAALFPSEFQESELGPIPKGWGVKIADELCDVCIGKTPPRKEHHWFTENPKDMPWMSIRDLGDAGVFISRTSEFLTEEAVEKFRVRRIPDNTVVLSFKLTVGRVAITDGEMLSNEAIAHFRLNNETSFGSAYLFCYLKGFGFEQLGSTSSIAMAINSDMIRKINILVPSKELADIFEVTVAPLFRKMKYAQRESHGLAALRDTLLPKLLSGELSVPEAMKEAASV